MPFYTDQLNRAIELRNTPCRIISVVPSQTELLADLGLDEAVAGITRFCIHPGHWHKSKTRVGGTKDLQIDTILALQPDLVIANKEENNRGQIEELEKSVPVWISDVTDYASALQMIRSIGQITGKPAEAGEIIRKIETGFAELSTIRDQKKNSSLRTAYLIWKDPYMAAGGDTYISDMLLKNGLENVFAGRNRYPVTNCEELINKNTELVILSSEPYPFREKHRAELAAEMPLAKIIIVDGEMFSWYGSRMLTAVSYFNRLQGKIGL